MKKLFITTITVFLVSLSVQAQGISALASTVEAQQKTDTARKTQNPFRLTAEEMKNGVTYLSEGVYRFSLTGGDFDSIKREFGPMLASFRKNHPKLQLEMAVATQTKPMTPGPTYNTGYIVSEYIVTFHLRDD